MPEVTIWIGGRQFDVSCQEGEEPFLEAAAALLDTEAQTLTEQVGRMPEMRMLLMAGLMLADKTAGLQDEVDILTDRLASQDALIEELRSREGGSGGSAEPEAAVDAETVAKLSALTELAEALASDAAPS